MVPQASSPALRRLRLYVYSRGRRGDDDEKEPPLKLGWIADESPADPHFRSATQPFNSAAELFNAVEKHAETRAITVRHDEASTTWLNRAWWCSRQGSQGCRRQA